MRKWLIGCGVLCAFVLLVVAVAGIAMVSYFKKRFPDAKKIEQVQQEMKERFGTAESFVPPLDGSLPPDRLEIFVVVRESLATRRAISADGLGFLADAKRPRAPDRVTIEKIGDKLGLMQGGLSMVTGLLDFFSNQQQLLLTKGMGQGEYIFYDALSNFAWLQWDPLADPKVVEKLREMSMLSHVEENPAARGRIFRQQLENARRELEAKATRSIAEEEFLKVLQAELQGSGTMAGFPFAGRVPPRYAAALEPYRTRLTAVLPQTAGEIALEMMHATSERDGMQIRGFGKR